jgi:hypothetical protein
LQTNRHRIELHRLPAYSPNLNPSEGSGRKPRSARLTTVSSRPRTNGTRLYAKHSSGSTPHQKCLPVRSRDSFDPWPTRCWLVPIRQSLFALPR